MKNNNERNNFVIEFRPVTELFDEQDRKITSQNSSHITRT